jgi:hypothetical protein
MLRTITMPGIRDVESDLGRLKNRDGIIAAVAVAIGMKDLFSRCRQYEMPHIRFFSKQGNLVPLSIVSGRLLILVLGQLFFQVTFTLAAGAGGLPVHTKLGGDIILVDPEIQDQPEAAKGLQAGDQDKQYGSRIFQHRTKLSRLRMKKMTWIIKTFDPDLYKRLQ